MFNLYREFDLWADDDWKHDNDFHFCFACPMFILPAFNNNCYLIVHVPSKEVFSAIKEKNIIERYYYRNYRQRRGINV